MGGSCEEGISREFKGKGVSGGREDTGHIWGEEGVLNACKLGPWGGYTYVPREILYCVATYDQPGNLEGMYLFMMVFLISFLYAFVGLVHT